MRLRAGTKAKRRLAKRRSSRRTHFSRGHLEGLESRQLLTVTSSFVAGTLSVSSDAADDIAIVNDGVNVKISVNGAAGINPGGGPAVAANTVTSVQINGFTGDFDNTVDLSGMFPTLFTAMNDINVDAGGGNDTTVLGKSLSTTLGQTYADAVVVVADITLLSTGGGDIRFLSTIDSNGTPHSLFINTTGTVELGDGGADYIGAVNPLSGFSTLNTTQTIFNVVDTAQPTVTTTQGHAHTGAVFLASDVVFVSDGFFLFSTIDSQDATARALTIDAGASSSGFGANVGSIFPLASITSSGAMPMELASGITINTTGNQTYNHAITFQGTGADFHVASGTITFGGALTGTASDVLADAEKVIINAGSSDDTLTLGHSGGMPSFTFDGVTHVLYPTATSFEFNGGGGDDTLVVNYAGGNPIPTGGLLFNGQTQGPGGDRLAFNGAGNAALYTPDATTSGAGTVDVDGRVVNFTGLEPVDITGMATVNINPAGVDDVLTVANGFDFATGLIPALRVSGTTGGVPIETVAVWNNGTVSINTATNNGNDTVTITSANNAHGNANLAIITGTGTDQIDVNGDIVVTGDVNLASQQINLTGGISGVNVALNSGGGSIADLNAGAINVAALNLIATAGTGIELDTAVDTITANTSATGPIVLREADTVQLTSVTSADGNIDVVSGGLMTALNVVAGGNGRDVSLETTASNISVGTVTALGDTVHLTAAASITDGNGLNPNVSAGILDAMATANISLDTIVDQIDAASTTSGAIVFRELDDVVLNSITTVDGGINVTAGGAMTVTLVDAGGNAKDVSLLTTAGGIAVDVINALDDTVTLASAADITDINPATPNVTANTLLATAVTGIALATQVALINAQTSGTGAISLDEVDDVVLNPVQSADGDVEVVAGGNITATSVTAGGASRDLRITSTGGSIGVGALTAADDQIELTASTSITDLNGAAQNVTARTAILMAGSGIGTAGDALETSIFQLEAAGGTGGVFLDNIGTLILGLLSAIEGVSSTGGEIDIQTAGPMIIVEDIVTTGGNITLAALETAAAGENLVMGNRAEIRSATGNISLSAGDDVDIHRETLIQTTGTFFIAADANDLDPFGSLVKLDGVIATPFLDITSGDDDDHLLINETVANQFNFTSVAPNSHTNAAFSASGRAPGNVGLHFEAGPGNDAMTINFTLPHDVAFFSDTNEPNSGVINVLNNYTMSFDGLAPLRLSGATGSLLVDATSTPATSVLTLDDNADPDDGFMVITGDGGFEETTFGGFTNLKIRGGDSSETINVFGIDTSKPVGLGGPLASIELDGSNTQGTDASADVFNIRTVPGFVSMAVHGGLGNDIINVASDAPFNLGSIDPIVGPLHIDGEGGNDTLVVYDRGDSTNDRAVLTSSTLTGMGLGTGITYLNIDQLDVFLGAGRDEFVLMLPLPSPVQAPLPALIRLQGGPDDQDMLTVIGTNNPNVADEAIVGNFGSSSPIQIQEVELLQMFGYAGPDRFINNTAVPSFLVGGDGPDTLQGGSSIDSIFGGDDLDQLFGNDSDDFLYPDHDIIGGMLVEKITDGDLIDGGNGFDSVLALGFGDLLRFISQSIDTGSIQDVITWLRGQFIPDTPAGRVALLNAGLAFSNSGSIADPALVPPPPPEVDLSGVVFDPDLFVQRAYFDYLDRDPALDPGGVQHFTAKVIGGASIEQIRSEILGSPEYFAKGGNATNAGFIANLYADLLVRAPSAAEINTWLGVLASGATRQDLALLILVSTEARNVQIGEIYDQLDDILFNGVLPPPGVNDVDRLALLADFANGLTIGEAESQLRAATTAGKQYSDAGVGDTVSFVIGLYRSPAVLGREPTAAELAPWLDALAAGTMSRKLVAFSILSSTEYRTRDVNRIYQSFLDRNVDPTGLNFSLAFLNTGGRVEALEVSVLSSAEYFQLQGGTNQAFVAALYVDALGRAGSAAEISQFTNALNAGTSRGEIAGLFVNSVEAQARVITQQYLQCAGRVPTPDELATGLERFSKGETRVQLLLRLILSAGFVTN